MYSVLIYLDRSARFVKQVEWLNLTRRSFSCSGKIMPFHDSFPWVNEWMIHWTQLVEKRVFCLFLFLHFTLSAHGSRHRGQWKCSETTAGADGATGGFHGKMQESWIPRLKKKVKLWSEKRLQKCWTEQTSILLFLVKEILFWRKGPEVIKGRFVFGGAGVHLAALNTFHPHVTDISFVYALWHYRKGDLTH